MIKCGLCGKEIKEYDSQDVIGETPVHSYCKRTANWNKEKKKQNSQFSIKLFFTKLFKSHFKRICKYATVGACGSIVNWTLLYCFTEFGGLWYMFSSIIATLCAFIFNYTFNTIWTYKDQIKNQKD